MVCNQTWFDSTASYAGVFCGKMGLLHLRSRSQQRFKMSVNVCQDDIFWTIKYFVTKFGMVMQQNEPECHAEKKCLLSSRSRSQRGLVYSNYDSDYYNFWTADFLPTRLGRMIGYHRQERLVEKLAFKVKVTERSKCQCLSRYYLLNRQTFCYQTWYCDASSWTIVSC